MAETTDGILATTGTRPAETGPGANGGTPTGGGVAVPTDETLMGTGHSEIGDTAGIGGPSDPSIAEDNGGGADPTATATGSEAQPDADAPTGGLSKTGTVGGVPTGSTESGMSSTTGPAAGGGGLSTPGTGSA